MDEEGYKKAEELFKKFFVTEWIASGEQPSAGDSQGRAHLNASTILKFIKYLTVQWKPWLPLTGTLAAP